MRPRIAILAAGKWNHRWPAFCTQLQGIASRGNQQGKWNLLAFGDPPPKTATDFASVTRQGHQISPQTDLGQLLFVALSFYYVAAALPVYGTRPSTDGSVESLNVPAGGGEKQFCQLINSKNKMPG